MNNYTTGIVLSILEESINNTNQYRPLVLDVAIKSRQKLNRFIHIELNENENRIKIEGNEIEFTKEKINNKVVVFYKC